MSGPLHIGIAGAGIGGLAAAALLAARGHRVTVLDRFDAPRPVGSGLVIQPVGQAVLAACGALDAALARGHPIRRMLGHEVDGGRPVLDVRYDPRGQGRFGLAIHRASLFAALLDAAERAGADILPGQAVSSRDAMHLVCDTGARHGPFDLIVDAAGHRSPLSPLRSRPLPYGAIWATVDWPADTDLPRHRLSQAYRRADRMLGVLPIGTLPGESTERCAIFWSLPRDGHADWTARGPDAWRAEAATLWPAFAPFAAQITDPAQMTMASYSHGTLRRPWAEGIAHIGDAAHRASPQLGQGANMALLDAHALALALDRCGPADAPRSAALARRWHIRAYQGMSAAFTPQYQSDSRALPVLRDRVLFPLSQIAPIPRVLSALVCGTMLPPLGSLTPTVGAPHHLAGNIPG